MSWPVAILSKAFSSSLVPKRFYNRIFLLLDLDFASLESLLLSPKISKQSSAKLQ